MKYQDSLNREIVLKQTPQRIVCLVPSLTELLHDMGLERQIVGITNYCVHPVHYKATKTIVGGTKKVKYKTIKDLKPDFILCSKEENTKEMVGQLEKIAPVYVTDVNSFDEALQLIKKMGIILDRRTQSEHILDKINYRYKEYNSKFRGLKKQKVAYFIWADPWMVAGGNTFINDMIHISGFKNAYADNERYPEINIKRMKIVAAPTLLMFSSEPHNFTDEEVFEVLRRNKETLTIYVDGQYFSWYGSRLIKAFDHFDEIHKKLSGF
jgi:ABC-type Fe3+-hydroxamate transport system substrate-binding protein